MDTEWFMNMLKKLCVILTVLAVFPRYPSVASDPTRPQWDARTLAPFVVPKVLDQELRQYRQQWVRVTNLEQSALHWNQAVVLYMNQGIAQYRSNYAQQRQMADGEQPSDPTQQGFAAYPSGTVLLKENYLLAPGVAPQPASVTVMLKREGGYDPAMGDWQFLQFDPAGNLLVNGNSRTPQVDTACAFCHRGMVERDYVFSTIVPTQGGRP